MGRNFLKLNDDKTEILVITTKRTKPVSEIRIRIGNDEISPVSSDADPPRNLGVYIDSFLSLDFHISKMAKAINFALYNVSKIRKYLDKPTGEMIINGLMMSRLDYCNSLFIGIPAKLVKQLQLTQNRAARILSLTSKFAHITPVMRDLHWLPVDKRIEFKVLLLCYKCVNGLAPPYLSDLLSKYVPTRSLRSADKDLLVVPSSCRLKHSVIEHSPRQHRAFGTSCLAKLDNQSQLISSRSGSKHIFSKKHMSDKRLGHLQSPQSKMPQRITLKCGDQEIQLHHHHHQ